MNDSDDFLDVTSKDIKILDKDNYEVKDIDINILFPPNVITDDHILITKLHPKNGTKINSVKLIATPSIGTTKKSITYSSVNLCTFFNIIDPTLEKEQLDKIKTDDNLTTNEKKSKIKQFNTIDKFRLFSKNEFYEPNKFKFSLESESGLSPLYIFTKALQILIDKVDALLEFNSDKIKISKSELNDIHNILIHEETHTIGNLLQSLIFNEYCRDKKKIKYIGYNVPHPLENDLLLKISLTKNDTDINDFLKESFSHVKLILQNILDAHI